MFRQMFFLQLSKMALNLYVSIFFLSQFGPTTEFYVPIRISERGLSSMLTQGIHFMKDNSKLIIPGFDGQLKLMESTPSTWVKYKVSNLQLTMDLGSTHVVVAVMPHKKMKLHLTVSNVSMSLKAAYELSLSAATKQGAVEIFVNNSDWMVAMSLANNGRGRLFIEENRCSVNVSNFDVIFEGSLLDSLLTSVRWLFLETLKDKVPGILSNSLHALLEDTLSIQLRELAMNIPLNDQYSLHFGVIGEPQYGVGAMELFLKIAVAGSDFSLEQSAEDLLFVLRATAFQRHQDQEPGFQLQLNDEILGGLVETAFVLSNLFAHPISKELLDAAGIGDYIVVPCTAPCFGSAAPNILQHYSDAVGFVIFVGCKPTIHMRGQDVAVSLLFDLQFKVRLPENRIEAGFTALTQLNILVSNIQLYAGEDGSLLLKAAVESREIGVEIQESAIGEVDRGLLEQILSILSYATIDGFLNKALSSAGVYVPPFPGLELNNLSLTLSEGNLVIGSDLRYNATTTKTAEDDSWKNKIYSRFEQLLYNTLYSQEAPASETQEPDGSSGEDMVPDSTEGRGGYNVFEEAAPEFEPISTQTEPDLANKVEEYPSTNQISVPVLEGKTNPGLPEDGVATKQQSEVQ